MVERGGLGLGPGETLALALEVTLCHHLPRASVYPCVPEGHELGRLLQAFQFCSLSANSLHTGLRSLCPPHPPPALCTALQGLWVPWAYPCIKKMGKLRHTEGKDLPKITQGVSEEAGQGPRAPYPSQCQEVGNEGVHLGLESGTVSAKPVEST